MLTCAIAAFLFPMIVSCACAQQATTAPTSLTGGPTISATGYNTATGPLFVASVSGWQVGTPFSVSHWIKTTSPGVVWIDTRAASTTYDFWILKNAGFHFDFISAPATGNNCTPYGAACPRAAFVSDGNWRNVCDAMTTSYTTRHIDGIPRDFIPDYVTFGYAPAKQTGQINDAGLWDRILSSNNCLTIYGRGMNGYALNYGSLQNGLIAIWRSRNCTGSGATLSCPEAVGGYKTISDLAAPTVAINAPASGATGLNGNVTYNAKCSDTTDCTSVAFYVDGSLLTTVSASPFTTIWNSANYIDGSHTLEVVRTNAEAATSTASVMVSTSNSVSAKTVYLDPTSGTDCPTNTGLSTSSPCSTLAGVMSIIASNPLHGGDSILLQHGTNLNVGGLTTGIVLALAGTSCAATYCYVAQNTYPGKTITLGTYGGGGNCHVLAGVTTDCASITLNANGTVPRDGGLINIFNVPNVTIQNLRLFGSQRNAIGCPSGGSTGCSAGIRYSTSYGFANGTAAVPNNMIIQNVEVVDFNRQVYVSGVYSPGYLSTGTMCGGTVQDNYLHGASVTSQTTVGLFTQNVSCYVHTTASTGTTALTVTSNFTADQGGTRGGTPNAGSGIQINTSNVIVDSYNATTAIGYGSLECGAGYGNWWYKTAGATVMGNESYNNFPSSSSGGVCDNGGFDVDNGVSYANLTFNYAHEVWGPAIGFFSSTVGGYPEGPNTAAYNIIENGGANVGDNTGGMIAPGGGYATFYNNDFWNGYNGQTNPVAGASYTPNTSVFGYGGACPPGGLIANNINVAAANGSNANMVSGGYNFTSQHCATINYKSNDWYSLSGNPHYQSVISNQQLFSVSAWNTASGDTGIQVNPSFGTTGTTCYSGAGSGIPVQPGIIPCPTSYELSTGISLIGTGLNLSSSPYNLTLPSTDYFNNATPNGVGTGWNYGADGAHH